MFSVALALVGNLATNTVRVEQAWWPVVVWVTAGLLVIGALANEASARRIRGEERISSPIDEAKEWLVVQEKDHRATDVARAQLRRPVPLRLRWSSTARPVAASRSVVLNATADIAWRDSPLEGDISEIVTEFRNLPNRQLVVLGEAGAGKSSIATLLGLGLMESRQVELGNLKRKSANDNMCPDVVDANHPIPVYLPIESWHPDEDIETFIARRLDEQFEFPTGAPEYATGFPDVFVRQGCLVPVLDGLDELPVELRASAIEALEAFAATKRPFVLTCRTAEYEQTVAHSGLILSRAAVVEIEPVDVETVVSFISESIPTAEPWADVFTHLRQNPHGPLAQVLSTPLMVSLTRIAYRPPGANPRNLLDLSDFTSIAELLLDQYISSTYPTNGRPQFGGERPSSRHNLVKITRWLAFLAHHMYQSGKRDLRWWQLTPVLVPRLLQRQGFLLAVATLLVFVVTGLAGLPLLEGRQDIEVAAVAAAIFGVGTSGMFSALWPSTFQPPSRLPPHPVTGMSFGIVVGALGGVLAAQPVTGLCAGVLCGLHATLAPHRSARDLPRMAPALRARSRPAKTITINWWNTCRAAARYGIVGGIAFAIVGHLILDTVEPVRTTVTGGVVCALGAAYCAGLGTWTRFRLTGLVLAMLGRLPWRLVSFLDEAHYRGVLRVAGDSWQFRHALLQDHLSEKVQSKNLWARIKGGNEDAVNRLADLYATQGRIGELRAIVDLGNRHATFRLIDALESIGRVDEALAIAHSRAATDWRALIRLIDLLADHGRTESLRRQADAGNSHAITRLAMLHAESGDIDEVVSLAHDHLNTNGWQATVPLLDVLSHHGKVDVILRLVEEYKETLDVHYHWLTNCLIEHGRVDELRALADQGCRSAADRIAEVLVTLGHEDEAVAIAREQAATGGWIPTKRLITVLVSAGRLEEAVTTAADVASTGNKLANELYQHLLAVHGATETIQALAHAGDALALGRHACRLAEQGHAAQAMTLVRNHAGRLELHDIMTIMSHVADHGHIDELRSMATTGNTQVIVHLMKLLSGTGNGDEAVAISSRYRTVRDQLTVGQIVEALVDIDRIDAAWRLAQSHDKGYLRTLTSQLIHHLVARSRPDKAIDILRGFAQQANEHAVDWLIGLLAATNRIDEAIQLAEETTNPRNDTWPNVDKLISLLTKQGRTDDAIAIARLRADPERNATWARLRTAHSMPTS